MNELLVATIMGIVQGFTEFLPISSTGHLIITGTLLGQENTPRMATFEVVIQLGSILAVVVLYWRRFWGLVVPQSDTSFSGIRGIGLLVLTSLPASLLGLVAHDAIKTHLFNPISVALALAVGGIFILLAEGRKAKPRLTQIDDITPKFALLVGCFQCLSLWPGFSRSASQSRCSRTPIRISLSELPSMSFTRIKMFFTPSGMVILCVVAVSP